MPNLHVETCRSCIHAKCSGRCLCSLKRKATYIEDVVRCPDRRFPTGAGDLVAAFLDIVRIGPLAKKVIRDVTGEGCGCETRQAALNKALPVIHEANKSTRQRLLEEKAKALHPGKQVRVTPIPIVRDRHGGGPPLEGTGAVWTLHARPADAAHVPGEGAVAGPVTAAPVA